jgi:hypothetical protein
MIGTRRLMSRSGLVRMLCALSLLLVAFAHNPLISAATASAYADVNVADYLLPDGTLPDLCLDSEGSGKHAGVGHCEACRIVSSVDLPSPFDGYVINRWIAAADLVVPQDARFTRPALRPSASPRGPPSFTA